ncbi:UNVERIFIED_CONTAM: amidohydrolase [Brevibacillus sp. OAP136]
MSIGTEWEWDSAIDERLYAVRKQLHQHPELSFSEHETCATIVRTLNEWGIPSKIMCETGVVVDIHGGLGTGRTIALRADIDALPIEEKSGVPFASQNPGVMHACGHDGHTTILLGAVYHLWKHRDRFRGLVRCIFQPGEEADGAAKKMIEAGVLSEPTIEAAVALHLWPHLPFGTVGVREGSVTASCDDFSIHITGKGGHSARPHQAVDAIAISAEVIRALQYLRVKMSNPVEPLVIHVGKINGGVASNVVADAVTLDGTIRSLTEEVRIDCKRKFIELVEGIAQQYGGKANVSYDDGNPAVNNNARVLHRLAESAARVIGEANLHTLPHPSMGADDFGYFAQAVPSTYFRLGIKRSEKDSFDLHHPQFYFDEAIIPIGGKIFTQFALNWLEEGE